MTWPFQFLDMLFNFLNIGLNFADEAQLIEVFGHICLSMPSCSQLGGAPVCLRLFQRSFPLRLLLMINIVVNAVDTHLRIVIFIGEAYPALLLWLSYLSYIIFFDKREAESISHQIALVGLIMGLVDSILYYVVSTGVGWGEVLEFLSIVRTIQNVITMIALQMTFAQLAILELFQCSLVHGVNTKFTPTVFLFFYRPLSVFIIQDLVISINCFVYLI